MNRRIKFFLISLCVAVAASAVTDLRLMTYNVHNGKGLDRKTDYRRLALVIDSIAPAVVAIQETDSATGRSSQSFVLAEIARESGMHHTFAPAIDYDGGKYGIGILSREEPVRVFTEPLPGREEKRTVVVAEFKDYMFACTHLSLTEADRLASLSVLCRIASACDKPFFIAGDLNAEPSDSFMDLFTKEFEIVSTTAEKSFPADSPDRLLDYIAVFNRDASKVEKRESHVVNEPVASDHRPVYADITIR